MFAGALSPGTAVEEFGDGLLEVITFATVGIIGEATSYKTFCHYESYRTTRALKVIAGRSANVNKEHGQSPV
jgi:hypothetical protein